MRKKYKYDTKRTIFCGFIYNATNNLFSCCYPVCCYNKLSQTQRLKTTLIYYLMALLVRNWTQDSLDLIQDPGRTAFPSGALENVSLPFTF